MGAPVGTYSVIVQAQSPNTHNANTYNYFSIDVETGTPQDYNLILSTVRSPTYEVTALRLDWNAQSGATDYNIYVRYVDDAFSSIRNVDTGGASLTPT